MSEIDKTYTLPGGTQYRPKYPDSPLLHLADFVNRESGKTYREENCEKQHAIPVGTLVETTIKHYWSSGSCLRGRARLWVVQHTRDCDGTPLYILSEWETLDYAKRFNSLECGYSEESLAIVENPTCEPKWLDEGME